MKKLIIDVVAPSSKTLGMYQYFDQIQALFNIRSKTTKLYFSSTKSRFKCYMGL
ncbi:hypothetical protein [Candidatus Tisiphia endosymbiont of Neophilaenus lineatus]|uniref:hypothetical protein n=1 Tax=Candidatus Tisiphia endosymbiont of Neophilaenus lineatus TaxID=3139336 RepID=UPI0035CB08BF